MGILNVGVGEAAESIILPKISTAQRNALPPETGQLIFNTDDFEVQFYNGTEWKNAGSAPFEATGGTVTDVGGYRIHSFTNDGAFVVTAGSRSCEFLVVAGGGGGGGWGGGGGAGGYRNSVQGELSGSAISNEGQLTAVQGSYTIKVGNGGSRGTTGYTGGGPGGDSYIIGPGGINITSIGGAGGGWWQANVPAQGGSGGGGSGSGAGSQGTPGQGSAGGPGQGSQSGPYLGHGGGGGAGQIGGTGSGVIGGTGGNGLTSSITGVAQQRAGGGGGHSPGLGNASVAPGGAGGGGKGGNYYNAAQADNGDDNSGGGGGGNYGDNSRLCGEGGSGIVIIRYAI